MYSISKVRVILTLVCLTASYRIALAQDHPCARQCILGEPPMDCDYFFTLENYHTMSKACYSCPLTVEDCSRIDCVAADGIGRDIITINRQIPGPKIEVCQGDNVNVALTNALYSDSTTIHWHGQHMRDTPYMDGVPFITQCPILPHNTFTYRFPAAQAGTNFYHSHISLQRGDGMFGALIVRQPDELNPQGFLYDQDLSEHTLVINDWHTEGGLQAYIADIHYGSNGAASAILVNGKGRFAEFTDDNGEIVYTPVERFHVESGQRYRFRVINNGVLACPVQISVDDHTLTVISMDANDILPFEVDSFMSYPGERFDFVLDANQESALYWVRFRGLQACAGTSAQQVAVLHYDDASEDDFPTGSTDYEDSDRDGVQLNSPSVGVDTEDEETISVANMRSVEDVDPLLVGTPDVRYVLPLSIHGLDNPVFHRPDAYGFNEVEWGQLATPQIAYNTMEMPTYPLLSQRDSIPEDAFCNTTTIAEDCEEEFCSCTHVAEIPLDALVEIIFFDESAFTNHPMHIHGLSFAVIGMEVVGGTLSYDVINDMDANGLLVRNLDNPPLKDTVQVPSAGYTIIRFIADNPGYWFMHCHLEFHAESAMAMAWKFGEHEDMVPVPPNFPTCGNYDPLNA